MKKVIIYRSKETNEIKSYHDMPKTINNIEDKIKEYNENAKFDNFAEIVELESNSVAYYFYTMKTREIKDEAEALRDIERHLRDLADEIDNRLNEFDFWLNEVRNGGGK